jgi:hypothetical protein
MIDRVSPLSPAAQRMRRYHGRHRRARTCTRPTQPTRDPYLKRHGRMPTGGSRLGTTSADAYARGHSDGDVGLDAQVKGKATRALPNMKADRDG